jgi:hypothetical protein
MKKIVSFIISFFILFVDFNTSTFSQDNFTIESESVNSGLTNIGFATFNLTSPDFNCTGFLSATKNLNSLHISFLYNTFGNDFSCLIRLLQEDRLDTLQIHLINEPGHRNNRLGDYEYLKTVGSVANYNKLMESNSVKLRQKFANYVEPLKVILDEYMHPGINLIINPGLESNLSDAGGKNLVSWAREEFPEAKIVWNPSTPAPIRRGRTEADFIEGHNLTPRLNAPCIYNMDGTDVSLPTRPALEEVNYQDGTSKNWVQSGNPIFQLIETYANKCEVAFIWAAESNGLDYSSSRFVDPRERNNFIPRKRYKELIKDLEILQTRGKVYPPTYEYSDDDNVILSSCNIIRDKFSDSKKGGNLLKQSEFRERGGVIILPSTYKSVKTIDIVKSNSVVDVYYNSGTYHDGRVLFRSNKSPTHYPLKTYLVFKFNSKNICYKIPNPRIRID